MMTMLGNVLAIRHRTERLDAEGASEIARRAGRDERHAMVLVDLKSASDATTAGLARLVLLRGRLLKAGRDLRIRGLTGRAKAMYDISRLQRVLPRRRRQAVA